MVDLLKRLTEANGVSGNENEVRDLIRREIEGLADEIQVDRIGNLIAVKKGKVNNKKVMLSAHMDEVGFIISGISDNGMLKFKTVGGMDPRVLVSKRVRIGSKGLPGVLGIKAIHLQERDERENAVKQKQMYIDIGAKSKEEAEKMVKPGDYAAFDSSFVPFGENRVKAKALDDRIGCAILIDMLKDRYDFDLIACFTVQEEVGLRGAEVASYHVKPDMALVLEGTTCSDVPGVDEYLYSTIMGKGPAISFMDRSSIGNKPLINALTALAEEKGIPYQFKKGTTGGNDAGKIHLSRGGVPTVAISVPCRYIHSPSSVVDLNDFNHTRNLVYEFLKGCDRV